MMNKEEKKTESSSSSLCKTSENSSQNERNDVEDESDDSSEGASESLRNSLVNTIATIQNNFFKEGKSLEAWHQFLFNKILYNKDYIHINEAFCFIERKIVIKREQIFYTAIFLLVAFVLLQNFDPLLCAIVSCFYPAYETTRSLTIHKNKARKQREHWLIYWIVFAFFILQDYYTEWLTQFFSPFLLLKMLFLMLLALPQTGVAELCYYNIVVPMLSILNDTFVKYNRRNSDVANLTANASEISKENDE
ncbi:TB2/DP1 HVA22 family protein [Acanthocheilonema viteae]